MKNISIIIPVYNEEETIKQCLGSLENQTLKPLEIMVVDDGSTDSTGKIIREIGSASWRMRGIRVIAIKQKHKGAGAARNLGVKSSGGDILVFIDGDMRFHRTFLEDLTEPIMKGKTKGTFSKLEMIANWNNIWARFWNYRRGLMEPRAVPKNYPSSSPVFRAILRSEFERVGGFDEKSGYNDDWSLSKKLGYKATETRAVFYHNNPDSLEEAIKQARWEAKRNYKWGILGIWKICGRGFGLMKIENSLLKTVFYLLFLAVINTAGVVGALEFYLFGKIRK